MESTAHELPGNSHNGARTGRLWGVRLALVVVGLVAWFGTQAALGKREFPDQAIGDAVLEYTESTHAFLHEHPAWADRLLISSSLVIDALGIFLLGSAILGPTIRPFLGLLILFSLRQLCQMLCALQAPPGMIWRDPGFPTLLVTYGVSNDLFFSGHTAIAVFGTTELAKLGRPWLLLIAVLIALFQIAAVLLLRAHYTMDVFAGAITALYVATLADRLAPACDRLIARISGVGAGQTPIST